MMADRVCPLNPDASRELGRLEGKVDALIQTVSQSRVERVQWQRDLDAKLFGDNGTIVRHAKRLTTLEHWRTRIGTGLKVLGVLWGLVVLVIGWVLSWGR